MKFYRIGQCCNSLIKDIWRLEDGFPCKKSWQEKGKDFGYRETMRIWKAYYIRELNGVFNGKENRMLNEYTTKWRFMGLCLLLWLLTSTIASNGFELIYLFGSERLLGFSGSSNSVSWGTRWHWLYSTMFRRWENVAGMLDREPNKAEEHLTHVCIHRPWHCPWQFLEELKEKLDNLIEIQPYKQSKKVGSDFWHSHIHQKERLWLSNNNLEWDVELTIFNTSSRWFLSVWPVLDSPEVLVS